MPNSASLTILPDREPLPWTGMQMAIDTDSWAWELTVTIPGRAAYEQLAVRSRPVELEAIINGYTFAVVIASVAGSEAFGSRTYSVRARSRSVYLASPYDAQASRGNGSPATMAQFALDALEFSGFAVGRPMTGPSRPACGHTRVPESKPWHDSPKRPEPTSRRTAPTRLCRSSRGIR